MITQDIRNIFIRAKGKNGRFNRYVPDRELTEEQKQWIDDAGLTYPEIYHLSIACFDDFPKCPVCGKSVRMFWKHQYCSSKCSANSKDKQAKVAKTNIMKYGNPVSVNSDIGRAKRKQTCLEKYGVDHYSKTQLYKEQFKQTSIERYGTEHPLQNNDIYQKQQQTNLERYGAVNVSYVNDIRDKQKQTNIERYGYETSLSNDDVRRKIIQTHRCNYYDSFIEQLKMHNLELIMQKEEYILSSTLHYRCLLCNNEFESNKSNPFVVACPYCLHKHVSISELELRKVVQTLCHDDMQFNVRKVLTDRRKELDIYIPTRKIAIEFNGNYYHSCWDNNYRELEKSKMCDSMDISLIHVYEYEWNAYRNNIVNYLEWLFDDSSFEHIPVYDITERNNTFILPRRRYPKTLFPDRFMCYDNEEQCIVVKSDDIIETWDNDEIMQKQNYTKLNILGYSIFS